MKNVKSIVTVTFQENDWNGYNFEKVVTKVRVSNLANLVKYIDSILLRTSEGDSPLELVSVEGFDFDFDADDYSNYKVKEFSQKMASAQTWETFLDREMPYLAA